MAKLVSKSFMKSIVWDYFGLELGTDGKTINDDSVGYQNCRKQVQQTWEHLKLVGTLPNEPIRIVGM